MNDFDEIVERSRQVEEPDVRKACAENRIIKDCIYGGMRSIKPKGVFLAKQELANHPSFKKAKLVRNETLQKWIDKGLVQHYATLIGPGLFYKEEWWA